MNRLPNIDTPEQFFDHVVSWNANSALEHPGDIRLAVNAIMTLDAFFGVLHAALCEVGKLAVQSDDQWKEMLACEDERYRLLRDAAYALKHGKLDGRKARLVRAPSQLVPMPGAFDGSFDPSSFQTDTVWISTDETDFRADETIRHVLAFANKKLAQIAPKLT